jgi:hypothetical protein
VFNRELLRCKLPFLSIAEFDSCIELLFTLLMYEEMETRQNMGEGEGYGQLL